MRRPARVIAWLLVAAVGVVGGATAIWVLDTGADPPQGPAGIGAPAGHTVEAVRRDIQVVVALEAVTVPYPTFSVLAAESGRVERLADIREDDEVATGQALFRVGSTEVESLVPSRVGQWLVPDGAEVPVGAPVAELRYSGFGLVASLPVTDAYRMLDGELSATGSISRGPAGFECPVLRVPSIRPDPELAVDPVPTVVCAIPYEVRAYADLAGQIALTSGQVTDVLTLPVTAVSGAADLGEVSVVAVDGTVTVRQVGLGATDGAVVEITSGLEEGTRVLASPPSLVR